MSNIFDNENIAVSPSVIARDRVENLSDKPNISSVFGGDGMTADDLKKAFDKIGVYLATRLKNLTTALKSADAGASIGIKNWDNTDTNLKAMLDYLKTSGGASVIGTGKSLNVENADLQEVIDNVYSLIASYELDDLSDIKTALGYSETSGEAETLNAKFAELTVAVTLLNKISALLNLNQDGTRSLKIEDIETDLAELSDSVGEANGIATLNNGGKLNECVDASKITSGKLPLSVIPDAAFERTTFCDSLAEMYALTIEDVQNGDIVVINGSPDKWYKVIDDGKLNESDGYREIVGGTTAVAIMAKEFDSEYSGANGIADKFSELEGNGRTTETIKGNSLAIKDLAGVGRTNETVKGNADSIADVNASLNELTLSIASVNSNKADKLTLKRLECSHAKSGTVHTFTLKSGSEFLSGVTEYSVTAKITADFNLNDQITLTDGETSYTAIVPLTDLGKPYKAAFLSGVYPIINFFVDLGGSEKHAFFISGGGLKIGDVTTEDKSDDSDYAALNGSTFPYYGNEEIQQFITPTKDVTSNRTLTYPTGLAKNGKIMKINGKYFAFPSSGISYSEDLVHWTAISNSKQYAGGAYGKGKYIFVHSLSGGNTFSVTQNLTDFTECPLPGAAVFYAVTYYESAGRFVMVGSVGNLYSSEDGVSWTHHDSHISSSYNIKNVKVVNGICMAFSGDALTFSTDGINWNGRTHEKSLNNTNDATYYNGKYYFAGDSGKLMYSQDLSTFNVYNADNSPTLYGFAAIDGALFLAGLNGRIVYTFDGNNFYTVTNFPSGTPMGVFIVDGKIRVITTMVYYEVSVNYYLPTVTNLYTNKTPYIKVK